MEEEIKDLNVDAEPQAVDETAEDVNENVVDDANETAVENIENTEENKKPKKQLHFKNPKTQANYEKLVAFLKRHETVVQAIKFTLISLVAFLSEFAVMYALQYGLYKTCGEQDFDWFVFHYSAGKKGAFGLAGFIAMLGSKLVAETISFTQNWKRNFKANSNRVFAVTVYVITVVCIIVFTQWMSGALAEVLHSEAALTVCKLIGSFVSFIVMFLMDKFVIMRKKKA